MTGETHTQIAERLIREQLAKVEMDPESMQRVWRAHAYMLRSLPRVLRGLTRDAKHKNFNIRMKARPEYIRYVQLFMDEYRHAVRTGDVAQLLGKQSVEFTRAMMEIAKAIEDHGPDIIRTMIDVKSAKSAGAATTDQALQGLADDKSDSAPSDERAS